MNTRAILTAALVLLVAGTASALELVRQKNVSTIIVFPIVDVNGDPVTSAAGLDTELENWADGTPPNGFADAAEEPNEIGSTGIYWLHLLQAEMNYDYVYVQVKTTTTGAKAQHLLIRTETGDPKNHATTSTGAAINVQAGYVQADVLAVSASTTAGTNLKRLYDTDFSDWYNTDSNMPLVDVNLWSGEAVTALADACDVGAELASQLDIYGVTSARLQNLDNLTGHVPQTGDTYALANNGTYGFSALQSLLAAAPELVWEDPNRLTAAATAEAVWEDPNAASPTAVAEAAWEDPNAVSAAVVAAIKAVTDALAGMLEVDGAVKRFTENALEQSPTGVGGFGSDDRTLLQQAATKR